MSSPMRRPPTLFFTLGLPGSGKSTWARQEIDRRPAGSITRVNKDDLRAMMHNSRHAGRATERHIMAARDALVGDALRAGVDVIVDDTNAHPSHERDMRELAAAFGATFVVKSFLDVPLSECIARDAQRTGRAHVGKDVIHRIEAQFAKRKAPTPATGPTPYVAPDEVPSAVLFDIDGTLARIVSRDPYDETRVLEDLPDDPTVYLLRTLKDAGEHIIVMSGRSEGCRQDTQLWLDEHVAPDLPLFMRASGDGRRDSVVKRDLFEEHVAGRYNVRFVVDDREQVVRMWRTMLGLKVYQAEDHRF